MNAPFRARGHLRVVEAPLTPEEVAVENRPSLEEVEAVWRAARVAPVPVYHELRRFVRRPS